MSEPTFERTQNERDLINELAYRIHLERGSSDGADVDDWLEAEQRLVEDGTIPADPRTVAPSQQGPVPATDGQVSERKEAVAPPKVR